MSCIFKFKQPVRSKIYILHSWKKQCLPRCTHTRGPNVHRLAEIKLGQNSITGAYARAATSSSANFPLHFWSQRPSSAECKRCQCFPLCCHGAPRFSDSAAGTSRIQRPSTAKVARLGIIALLVCAVLCPGGAQFRSPLHTMCN